MWQIMWINWFKLEQLGSYHFLPGGGTPVCWGGLRGGGGQIFFPRGGANSFYSQTIY